MMNVQIIQNNLIIKSKNSTDQVFKIYSFVRCIHLSPIPHVGMKVEFFLSENKTDFRMPKGEGEIVEGKQNGVHYRG